MSKKAKSAKHQPNSKKKSSRILPPSKDEHVRLTLEQARKCAEQKKYKPAIQIINKGLNSGLPESKLLNQKAQYLAESGNFNTARSIWEELKKSEDSEIASEAIRSIKISQQRQTALINKTKTLLQYFHTLANSYQKKLKFIPEPKTWSADQDLAISTSKEINRLREEGCPKLALLITERAINEGFHSFPLIKQKTATLAAAGKLEEAKAILNNLNKNSVNLKLKQDIKQTLQSLEPTRKQFLKKRPRHLLLRCHAFSKANNWDPKHLPKPNSIKPNTSDQESKNLAIQEISKLFKLGKYKIALGIIGIVFEFYDHAPQVSHLKAKCLASTNQLDAAIEILKPLLTSKSPEDSTTALELIREGITNRAKQVSKLESADKALEFFINKHLQHGITPEYNQQLGTILTKTSSVDISVQDPKLRQQELNLQFNTALIARLESQLKNPT